MVIRLFSVLAASFLVIGTLSDGTAQLSSEVVDPTDQSEVIEISDLPASFSVIGDLDLEVGETISGEDVTDVGVTTSDLEEAAASSFSRSAFSIQLAANSPVLYQWKDQVNKTMLIRSNIESKIRTKHNLTWKVARTTTQYAAKRYHQAGTTYRYETPVYRVTCSGVWIFRKCKVAETVNVRAVVDYRTNTSDGRTYGVVTTYCLTGAELCPSFVKNALNV